MSQAWIDSLREGYEAFNAGDIVRVLEQFGAGFSGRERPDSPEARSFEGDTAALDALRTLHSEFDDYRFEPQGFDVVGNHVIASLRQSGRGRISGIPIDGDIVHVWEIGEDDRARSLRAFSTKDEALAALDGAP
ncbi:MAG TPA: nuclear transport factor 2 family protein [Thermoleophilaceae bacterium]|nr:nuclear transport factor 2 family protein [Thermoleophilaceae bacterium]